ncbi:MAG TPA: GAF domain-containing protein [Firmicutes bacterium]|nr:GAF domain-containing protein [Bacillota bacterium]
MLGNYELLDPENLWQELQKERKRVIQWRILSDAAVILNSELHSGSLPLKFIKCAKKLVSANEAMLAIKEEKREGLKVIKHYTFNDQEKQVEETGKEPFGAIKVIMKERKVINRNASEFTTQELRGFSAVKENLLGVPLYADGEVIGAFLMANKCQGGTFTQDDQELLLILASQLSIALENSRLYEKTDIKLQTKVDELEQANNTLIKQQTILEKSIELHTQLTKLVLEGRGIKAICKSLTAFIGCPVQIEDQNFNVRASTMPDDMAGLHLGGRDLLDSKEHSRPAKRLFQEKKPIKIVLNPGATQYVVPIIAGGQVIGIITMVLTGKPLRPLYMVAMEQGATIVALEMLKEKSTVEQSRRLKESFFEQIIGGDFESEEQIQHRALQLNLDINGRYKVIAADLDPGEDGFSRPELFQEIRERFIDSFPDSVVVAKNNLLLVFCIGKKGSEDSKDTGSTRMEKFLEDLLGKLGKEKTWWIAVGTGCKRVCDCGASYQEAATTLEIMKALHLDNKLVSYSNLGIFSLIEINPRRFADFTQKTLGSLIEYDQKHKTQLIKTLNLYFEHNRNVLKASRKGYLNPSTMKYRLRRIQEITGLDLKDADVGLQLHLAIRLINYRCV